MVEHGRAPDAIRLPDTRSLIDLALERYAHLFLAAERMRDDGRISSPADARELAAAAAALDRARPHAAEDLRVVLDRGPDPSPDPEPGRAGELRRAWAEGRLLVDPAAHAERFVADWRAVSKNLVAAGAGYDQERAERRLERLEERMLRQPALEKALDARIPERQLRVEDPGMSGGGRDRDLGMGL